MSLKQGLIKIKNISFGLVKASAFMLITLGSIIHERFFNQDKKHKTEQDQD